MNCNIVALPTSGKGMVLLVVDEEVPLDHLPAPRADR